jgi:hypothetical protein
MGNSVFFDSCSTTWRVNHVRFVKTALMAAALVVCLLSFAASSNAALLDQWASSVIDYSSYYYDPSWSKNISDSAPTQALGAPDTFSYGDQVTAWAPMAENGTKEYITLGYTTPVYANGVTIRETWGNGFVYQVDLLDLNNVLHTVWTGTDPSQPGSPVDFSINFTETTYLVTGVRIYIDTNHSLGTWEEIDAVQLSDPVSPVPLPSTMLLLGSGLVGLGVMRRKRSLKQ